MVATNAAVYLLNQDGDHTSKDDVDSADTAEFSMEALVGGSGRLERADITASSSGVAARHQCSMDLAGSDDLSVEDLEVDSQTTFPHNHGMVIAQALSFVCLTYV